MFDSGIHLTRADHTRLVTQLERMRSLMSDGKWRTVPRIAFRLGIPEPSVSAQLRNFRKARYGGHTVNRRRVGNTYEYQLEVTK